jgi:hypothetical protein
MTGERKGDEFDDLLRSLDTLSFSDLGPITPDPEPPSNPELTPQQQTRIDRWSLRFYQDVFNGPVLQNVQRRTLVETLPSILTDWIIAQARMGARAGLSSTELDAIKSVTVEALVNTAERERAKAQMEVAQVSEADPSYAQKRRDSDYWTNAEDILREAKDFEQRGR